METFLSQITMNVCMTLLGSIVGWSINGLKNRTHQLHEKTQQEEVEREQNRKMLGELLFYRLEDLHRRYVVQGNPCSAADKQQIDDIYHHYHDELGLNGPGTHMYNEIMEIHQG